MSTSEDPKPDDVANQTLAYLRQIDKKFEGFETTFNQIMDSLKRLENKMSQR